MAHVRSGNNGSGFHPALKGVSTSIPKTDDGIVEWNNRYQVSASRRVLPLPKEMVPPPLPLTSVRALCCHVPLRFLNSILAVLTVVCNVAMNVTLPIYADAMIKAGGDVFDALVLAGVFFPVIFFVFLIASKLLCDRTQKLLPIGSFKVAILVGFLTAMNGLLIVFASPAERTPPYLQGILTTTLVPFTVFFRYLVLRKGKSVHSAVMTRFIAFGICITFNIVVIPER